MNPNSLETQSLWNASQVYNVRQAKTDIDAVYSMGLFDDVTILPQPSEDSTPDQPKVSAIPVSKTLPQIGVPHEVVKQTI